MIGIIRRAKTKPGAEMDADKIVTKLSRLKANAAAGNWEEVLRIAAKFHELGDHKGAITRAWAAIQNPQFYLDIGQEPATLISTGIAAIKERYQI
jgi:hypothetical protein